MRLEHTADMPMWARVLMVPFSLVFAWLTWWLIGLIPRGGAQAGFMALVTGFAALRLLTGAIQGRWTFRNRVPTGLGASVLADDSE